MVGRFREVLLHTEKDLVRRECTPIWQELGVVAEWLERPLPIQRVVGVIRKDGESFCNFTCCPNAAGLLWQLLDST